MNKELYIKNKLNTFNQNHLLKYYEELSSDEKEIFNDQIYNLDLNLINNLYTNSFNNNKNFKEIKPLPIINKEEIDEMDMKNYINYGENIIKNNKYAIVLMAGGSGTRLGSNKPKGLYEFYFNNENTTLFKLFFSKINEAKKKYNTDIPVYIMTSESNYMDTLSYLELNNYFNSKIKIFVQDNLPLLDVDGNIILKNKFTVYEEPNGNGNVFKSIKTNGILDELNKYYEWIYFCGIDNILNDVADTSFIGVTALNKYLVSSKTFTADSIDNTNYVYCYKDNLPSMLTKEELTKKIFNTKINNKFVYRENNLLMHLINIEELNKYCDLDLEYHRTYKKYHYLEKEDYVFKFEQFIFDAFKHSDSMLCYSINKFKEFYPIKTKKDIDAIIAK